MEENKQTNKQILYSGAPNTDDGIKSPPCKQGVTESLCKSETSNLLPTPVSVPKARLIPPYMPYGKQAS